MSIDERGIVSAWSRRLSSRDQAVITPSLEQVEEAIEHIVAANSIEATVRAGVTAMRSLGATIAAFAINDGRCFRIGEEGIVEAVSGRLPAITYDTMGDAQDLDAPFPDRGLYTLVQAICNGRRYGWLYACGRQTLVPERMRMIADIMASKLANIQALKDMERTAITDPLTRLFNKRGFEKTLAKRLEAGKPFVVAVGDCDGFKHINDERGHDAGDRVLAEIGGALRAVLREGDVSARQGGDEFAVIARGDDPRSILARIRSGIRRANLRMSWGCAAYPVDGADAEALMRCADSRMYEEKRRRKTERLRQVQRGEVDEEQNRNADTGAYDERK